MIGTALISAKKVEVQDPGLCILVAISGSTDAPILRICSDKLGCATTEANGDMIFIF